MKERGNVRHCAVFGTKTGGGKQKILPFLQVLKNTEVKRKIKTKTVSKPVAVPGGNSALTHSYASKF